MAGRVKGPQRVSKGQSRDLTSLRSNYEDQHLIYCSRRPLNYLLVVIIMLPKQPGLSERLPASSTHFPNTTTLHLTTSHPASHYLTVFPPLYTSSDSRSFFLNCCIDHLIPLLKVFNGFHLPMTYRTAQKSLHMKGKNLKQTLSRFVHLHNFSPFLAPVGTDLLHIQSACYSTAPTCLELSYGSVLTHTLPQVYPPSLAISTKFPRDVGTKCIKSFHETYQGIPGTLEEPQRQWLSLSWSPNLHSQYSGTQ